MSVHRFRPGARKWEYFPEHAGAQIPRYTSYPPANRFSADIDERAARQAIERLPPRSSLSLYLHIPFCKALCWYCGCHTSVPTAADPLESYVDALVREIELVGQLAPGDAQVTHIHFGGGSPDILSTGHIDRIFQALLRWFKVPMFAEIAAELDPRGVTGDRIAALVNWGLNRASLGVQVLDPSVQRRINRIQPVDEIEGAIHTLRRHGVPSLNCDVMYGLPGQTREHVIETALFVARQDADRVAAFGYAHVPWMKKHQKSIATTDLPQGEERFRQAEAAAATLESAGYLPVGFDHFAAPGDALATAAMDGRLHRNFQGYTDDDATALIGLGVSAISCLPGLIYQNTTDSALYRSAVQVDRMPVARGVAPSAEDTRIARIIEKVLCDFEADVPDDLLLAASTALRPLISSGIAELNGARLSVTGRGQPYARNVAACFDLAVQGSAARHSTAI